MFKVAICDDEKVIGSQIENILLEYSEKACLKIDVKVFYSGEELYEYIESGYRFDLIYLDIEMGLLSGLEVGKKIRNIMKDHKTEIVYISGKDGYDRELFDVQPLHFIPKPINLSMIIEDLKLAMLRADKWGGTFSYSKATETYRVQIKDIIYFESMDREIRIVTVYNEDVFYGSIQKVFESLSSYQFIKIHRSYLVNYSHIDVLRYHEVIMSNKVKLPISQSRRKEVREIQLKMEREA